MKELIVSGELYDSVQDPKMACPEPSEVHEKWVSGWQWTGLTPKNRLVTCGIAAALASLMTLTGATPKTQVGFWMVAAAVMLALDPLDLFDRILARKSCILVSSALGIGVVALGTNVKNIALIAVGWAFTVILLIWSLNKRWIALDSFKATGRVEYAALSHEGTEAGMEWSTIGKRECRTLLHEMGQSVDEEVLDTTYRSIYYLGFATGHRRCTKREVDLQAVIRDKQKQHERIEDHCSDLGEELRNLRSELAAYRLINNDLKQELELTRLANDELVEALPDPEEAAAALAAGREQRARDYLSAGYSIRRVVELTGLKKWKVSEIRKELNLAD